MEGEAGGLSRRAARFAATLVVAAGVGLASAGVSHAQEGGQVHVGPQINFATDTDVGIGVRLAGDLGGYPGWELIGSFDVYFPDGDFDFWEINGNAIYNLDVRSTTIFPYVGGGLNVAHRDGPGTGDGSDTDLGLNVLGGVKFATDGPVTPYAELRGTIEGSDQLVVTIGVLFP